jgi:hypothetical protein
MSKVPFSLPAAASGASAAVCIIGMHRSGTSVTTRLLNVLGLSLGPSDRLMGAGRGNATGHFEHLGFLEINEALLHHFGGSWRDPPEFPPGWQNDPVVQRLTEMAGSLVAAMSADHGPWGWKEPRTTVLLPFWQRIIPRLRYVICIRNPLEVANSLAERDRMTIAAAVALWRRYTRAALAHTSGHARTVIFYEDYFSRPLRELNRLAEFCGLARIDSADGLLGVLAKDLRHQRRGAVTLLLHPAVSIECKLLYLGLRARHGRWPGEAGFASLGRAKMATAENS